MVDIEKFKSEFKNMKMQSDLMVKHGDVQELVDKFLTESMYFVVSNDDGRLLKIEKSVEEKPGIFSRRLPHFVKEGFETHFETPEKAVKYLINNKDAHLETRYG